MSEFGVYHKIQSVYKRSTDGKRMLFGDYTLPEFDYLRYNEWVFTEKVDGTNVRVGWDGHTVTIGGKTDNAQLSAKLYGVLTQLFPAEKFATVFPCAFNDLCVVCTHNRSEHGGKYAHCLVCETIPDRACLGFVPHRDTEHTIVTLHGEGYGAQIMKMGAKYRSDQSFILFDVRIGSWWLKREDVEDVARKLGIDVVPIIGNGTLIDLHKLCAEGFKSAWGDFTAEGIVARPRIELQTRAGERLITKLKVRDFRVPEAA